MIKSKDEKMLIRLLNERDSSRENADNLARSIMEYLSDNNFNEKILIKALKKYSNDESWTPGIQFIKKL